MADRARLAETLARSYGPHRLESPSVSLARPGSVLVYEVGEGLQALADTNHPARRFIKTPHTAKHCRGNRLPFPPPGVKVIDAESFERKGPHVEVVRDQEHTIVGIEDAIDFVIRGGRLRILPRQRYRSNAPVLEIDLNQHPRRTPSIEPVQCLLFSVR
jgi:hypothetical protein